MNSQNIDGEHIFQELKNIAEGALRTVEDIRKVINNNNRCENGEQNQGKCNYNVNMYGLNIHFA